jgi:DNA modification methylase
MEVTICLDRDGVTIHNGDCLEVLRTMPDESVQCCVTSPPYWGLRDYGHDRQIGLESTPEAYVGRMVEVFREVRRVLREDGTLWLNLGDSYASSNCSGPQGVTGDRASRTFTASTTRKIGDNLKPKDLVGIPWRVAFALQADGWYLRQDIIWHKPNPMPESVTDRCTKAHEYVFLLAKSQRYYYDAEAISEDAICDRKPGRKITDTRETHGTGGGNAGINSLLARYHEGNAPETRNRRSVWTVCTKPYSGAHFAVMPPDLVKPCILAGCPEGGVVLDPFMGSGTVAAVAQDAGRRAIGIELNPEYCKLITKRFKQRRML